MPNPNIRTASRDVDCVQCDTIVEWKGISKDFRLRGRTIGGHPFDCNLDRKDIPEIAKSRRYANRPTLDKIFNESILGNKRKKDGKISEAVEKSGYTQRSIANHLGLHFPYVGRILHAAQ